MKIFLINPVSPVKKQYFKTPPFGLLSLSASLKKSGFDVKVFDFFSFPEESKKVDELIKNEKPDIVGITGMSFQHNSILSMANRIKQIKIIQALFGNVCQGGLHQFSVRIYNRQTLAAFYILENHIPQKIRILISSCAERQILHYQNF